MSSSFGLGALQDLRKSRRRHRLADIHWSDAIYRIYIFTLCVGGLVWWVIATLGSRPLDDEGLASFVRWAPVGCGGVLALSLWGGLRSGLRGGPIALEHADLVHVLGSPLPRQRVLRYPALQQFRRGVFIGAGVGGVAGRFTSPFVPGGGVRWTLVGAVFGGLCGALWMSAALIASGRRLRSLPTQTVAFVLSALTLLAFTSTDIISAQGFPRPVALLVLLVVVVALSVFAIASCGGINVERAQQRAALVGQLRFAVTTQDLRAVVLVRRQLNSEAHRVSPWIRVPSGKGVERAVLARCARSFARWPARRFVRLLLVGVVAGVGAQAGWQGALPLLLIPGLAGFLGGLDVVEPLSQDADHLSLLASYPRHRGRLANRLIIVPTLVMIVVGLIGAVAGWLSAPLFGGSVRFGELAPALGVGVVWAVAGTLAAALSVALGPPPFSMMLLHPELGFARLASLPGLSAATVGVPLFLAHRSMTDGGSAGSMLSKGLAVSLFLCFGGLNVLTSGGVREPK